MVISDEEQRQIQRRILHQVARRIGIERPEDMEENKELFRAMEGLDDMALRIMAGYRNAYQQWCVKSNELEQAARAGKPLGAIQSALIGLSKERDVHRDSLVRYLDHRYPNSVSRVTA